MSFQIRCCSHWLTLGTILFWIGLDRPAQAGVGAWTPVGPGAAEVREIASITVHPGSPGSVWVGIPQGGLYRSSDQGVNWRWVGLPFIGQEMEAVAAAPTHAGALWGATSTAVFRTEDGGAHWTKISDESYSTTPLDRPQEMVAVPGALYIVTWQRLLASTDGGRTWKRLYDQGSIRSFAASSSRTLYLAISGDSGGLLQSLDGGQTWAPVTSCPPAVRQVVLTPTAAYAAVEGNAAGILRSTDLGRTWRPVLGGTPSWWFDVSSVAVDPRSPRTLYVSGQDSRKGRSLWVSHDAGKTWVMAAGLISFSRLRIDASNGILYGDEYGYRLQKSRDGGATWTTVLRPPDSAWSEAARINFRPGDPSRAALAVGFVLYRSVNGGATWKLSGFPGQPYDVDLDPADPNRLIASTDSGVFFSEDAGRTWQWAASSGSARYLEILVRVDAQILLAGGAGMWRSDDNGRSWQAVLSGWPSGSETTRWVQKIEVDPVHPSTIYALSFQVNLDGLPHGPLAGLGPSILWRSTDSGRTWKKMTLNLRTFAVDPATSRLYGVRDRQIFASDDGGKTWRQAGRTPIWAHDLVIDPTKTTVFYTTPRLWRSRDRGVTWALVTDQRRPLPVVLTFDPRNSRILYGADRYSVYTITVPD